MELYINLPLNSIKITNDEETEDYIFLTELGEALAELDRSKKIRINFDTEFTPLVVVLYLKKVREVSEVDIEIFNRQDSEALRKGLEALGFEYNSLKDNDD
jgi:hypothetical protein